MSLKGNRVFFDKYNAYVNFLHNRKHCACSDVSAVIEFLEIGSFFSKVRTNLISCSFIVLPVQRETGIGKTQRTHHIEHMSNESSEQGAQLNKEHIPRDQIKGRESTYLHNSVFLE